MKYEILFSPNYFDLRGCIERQNTSSPRWGDHRLKNYHRFRIETSQILGVSLCSWNILATRVINIWLYCRDQNWLAKWAAQFPNEIRLSWIHQSSESDHALHLPATNMFSNMTFCKCSIFKGFPIHTGTFYKHRVLPFLSIIVKHASYAWSRGQFCIMSSFLKETYINTTRL